VQAAFELLLIVASLSTRVVSWNRDYQGMAELAHKRQDPHIFEIYGTTGRAFRRDQILTGYNVKYLILVGHLSSTLPSLLKNQARGRSLNVDPNAVPKNCDLVSQQIFGRREQRSTEVSIGQAPRILRIRFDQHIEVESCARDSVSDRRNAADDKVFNVVGVQGREHVQQSV